MPCIPCTGASDADRVSPHEWAKLNANAAGGNIDAGAYQEKQIKI